MIRFYNPLSKQLPVEECLKQSLNKIIELTGCDIIEAVVYDSGKNFMGFLTKLFSNQHVLKKKLPVRKFLFKDLTNSFFEIVVKEKQIVIYRRDDEDTGGYRPFSDDTYQEVFMPIFSETFDTIGCMYLGYLNGEKNVDIDDLLHSEMVNEYINFRSYYQMWYKNYLATEEFYDVVQMIMEIVRSKDPFISEHPYNVAQWAAAIARKLSFKEERIKKIYLASVLHDIGKLYIGEEILKKTEDLTPEEYQLIKMHSVHSYSIIHSLPKCGYDLNKIAEIVLYHHERYDGDGYPKGLKGENIPLESRIICVADAVDAMLSERSFRKPKSVNEVIRELIDKKGKQFDPEIADIMINLLLKTKEMNENVLSAPLIWSTISITTEKDTYAIPGTLTGSKNGYVFKSNIFNFSQTIDKTEIKKISLYVREKKNIFEYEAKFDYMIDNKVYISNLIIKPFMDSFSILWDLEGRVIDMTGKKEVHIYKIGGSSLSFWIDCYDADEKCCEDNTILTLKIFFDNETEVKITGEVVNCFEMSKKKYYEIRYINIPDFIKDKIFKELFRRQIEIKKLINEG